MVPRIALAAWLLALMFTSSAYGQGLVPGTGFSSALELTPGSYSFAIAPGEIHFFKIMLEPGDILVAKVRMAANQDFDLYLLNPLREIVGQSVRATGLTDAVEYTAVEKGPHYIVVLGFGDSAGVYSLTISVIRPKTVTQTVTAVVTERVTETVTTHVFNTNTLVSERIVTVVDTERVEVEKAPWTAAGLAILAAALLYTGHAASEALKSRHKQPPEEQKPPSTTSV